MIDGIGIDINGVVAKLDHNAFRQHTRMFWI